jgi:phosphoglycolate/pyridoxal phosphate phosphatase family enzyme
VLLLLVDLDGVVYRGADPVPGVAAVLADRAAKGDAVVYVTNNAMHYRADYVPRLAALGAPVSPDRIVTSARATALYIADHHPEVRRVLTVGARGLERELADVGRDVTPAGDVAEAVRRSTDSEIDWFAAAGRPDAVVVGIDQAIDYLRIAVAADCIRAGALFIATNRDPTYPSERRLMPGGGAIVAAVEVAAGRHPLVTIGKPEPLLLEEAAGMVGLDPSQAIMIGDSLVTDIAAARTIGARSVLMLTGVTTRAQADALSMSERPTEIAADAADLARALERFAPVVGA